jgi:hypothetical protein
VRTRPPSILPNPDNKTTSSFFNLTAIHFCYFCPNTTLEYFPEVPEVKIPTFNDTENKPDANKPQEQQQPVQRPSPLQQLIQAFQGLPQGLQASAGQIGQGGLQQQLVQAWQQLVSAAQASQQQQQEDNKEPEAAANSQQEEDNKEPETAADLISITRP